MYTVFTKIKRRMGVFLLIAVFITLFSATPASAAEAGAPQSAPHTTVSQAPVTAPMPTAPAAESEGKIAGNGAGAAGGEGKVDAETLAGAVADFLREESAGILSGATLLLTLTASILFRKRLLPPLLEALGTLIGKSREAVGAIHASHEEEKAALEALLTRVEGMLDEARAATAAAESAAAELLADGRARAAVQDTLTEQSDLLYELLMSANLPQYQKDRIGEQHAKAKAAAVKHHE